MPRYLAVDISEMKLYDCIILEKVWLNGDKRHELGIEKMLCHTAGIPGIVR